jgi:two-component system, OmpR family, torCAD operon response regulator TorR
MEDPHYPRRKGAKRRARQPKAASPSGRLHVLVVEDDVTTRESLEAYFSLLGHRARLAADAASALEAARDAQFDALLCDLRLPDGDGCELLR